jgi:hypothetical protein
MIDIPTIGAGYRGKYSHTPIYTLEPFSWLKLNRYYPSIIEVGQRDSMIKPNCSPSFLKRSSCPSTKQIQRSDFPNWKQINMEQIIYIYIFVERFNIFVERFSLP